MNKIGILTQPLCFNYGGLLQAYALQFVLKKMGFKPYIIDRHNTEKSFLYKRILYARYLIYCVLGKKTKYPFFPKKELLDQISRNTNKFIDKYIQPRTEKVYSTKEITTFIKENNITKLIVGSDQVWRPLYSPHLPSYFFDFVKSEKNIIRISYAASFGVDYWEYSKKEEKMAKDLLTQFNAVSVREDSAVDLCQKYFNIKSMHVLDPTMLLRKEDYLDLIKKEKEPVSKGKLFTYILDPSDKKSNIIKNVSETTNLKSFSVQPKKIKLDKKAYNNIDDYIYPSVTKWLRAFYDAEFVITDSFHGCVFSIIFNKPFLVIGNENRGMARFKSLLKMYNLESRLYQSTLSLNKIDWSKVNCMRDEYIKESMFFLKQNL